MDPAAIDARCVIGRTCAALCARAKAGRQRRTRLPTSANAVTLEGLLICAPWPDAYDETTVKLISFVSVLFAILSVTLISSR